MKGLKRAAVPAVAALVIGLAGCGDDGPTAIVNPATLRVINEAPGNVRNVHARVCGTTAWGNDLLPESSENDLGVIPVGESRDFVLESGCYDLRATFFDTDDTLKEDIDEGQVLTTSNTATNPFEFRVSGQPVDPT